MLRAISEIGVGSSVWPLLGIASPTARARARWRAVTKSASDAMGIRSACSGATVTRLLAGLEQGEPLLEVARGLPGRGAHRAVAYGEPALGPNPPDHSRAAAAPCHDGDPAQRAPDERAHHVQRRHGHDGPA